MMVPAQSLAALAWAGVLVGVLPACKRGSEEASASSTAPPLVSPASSARLRAQGDIGKAHRVGERAQGTTYAMTIESVKECKVQRYFKPRKANIKLGVEVVLEGIGDKEVPVNPFYAKITDKEGYSYTSTFAGCEPALKSVRIGKGEKAKGWITFELPKKASGLVLRYSPFVVGTDRQDLVFALNR